MVAPNARTSGSSVVGEARIALSCTIVICLLETAAFAVTLALTLWRWLDFDPEPPQPTIRSIPPRRTRDDASRREDILMLRLRANTAAIRRDLAQCHIRLMCINLGF